MHVQGANHTDLRVISGILARFRPYSRSHTILKSTLTRALPSMNNLVPNIKHTHANRLYHRVQATQIQSGATVNAVGVYSGNATPKASWHESTSGSHPNSRSVSRSPTFDNPRYVTACFSEKLARVLRNGDLKLRGWVSEARKPRCKVTLAWVSRHRLRRMTGGHGWETASRKCGGNRSPGKFLP
jgi:hypothetical protein